MQNQETFQIRGYYDLKSKFSHFAMLCEEELAEENNLIISFESAQDITMGLSIFGQPMEISFSMAIDEKNNALGKLHFARIPCDEKRQSIMKLYFNLYGYIRYSPNGPPSLNNICDKDSIQMVLVHLLVTYARKNQLSYMGNMEIDPSIYENSLLTEQ